MEILKNGIYTTYDDLIYLIDGLFINKNGDSEVGVFIIREPLNNRRKINEFFEEKVSSFEYHYGKNSSLEWKVLDRYIVEEIIDGYLGQCELLEKRD